MVDSFSRHRLLRWLVASLLLLSQSSITYGEQETLGELSVLQQDIRWLKATLEHLKLQRELGTLRPQQIVEQNSCQPDTALGGLALTAVYALNQQYYAALTYHHTPIVVRRGERLLCGETVLKISLEGLVVEKQGRRYQLSGRVATQLPLTQVN